jgi:UDP-2,4-diacetamido-2,4,6-trideoxy-beta-L-altropyranose hydrolase
MRCLTLAEGLKAEGATCRFICREHAGHLAAYIRQRGFEVALLPLALQDTALADPAPYAAWLGATWEEDASQVAALLASGGKQDWLVADHYALDARWEHVVGTHVDHVLVIDDLANRSHRADILLDQTVGRDPADYRALVNPDCELRCGVAHVLLRPDYDDWREASLARRQQSTLKNVLISLGGVDKDNYSREVLLGLCESSVAAYLRICMVLGESSPWIDMMRSMVGDMTQAVELKVGVDNMPELLASCDLAIGAAGTSAWERCCLGVPALMLTLADNQREIAARLAEAGAVRALEVGPGLRGRLMEEVEFLAANPDHLASLSRNAARLVPGSGVKPLARAMSERLS